MEKEIRGILKSEAIRLLTPENVVILDAGNYIKGNIYNEYSHDHTFLMSCYKIL